MAISLTQEQRAIRREQKREEKAAHHIAKRDKKEHQRLFRIGNPNKLTSDDYWLFVVSCLGVVLVMSAMASLNTVLPDIAIDTRANQSQLTWIVDAYTLALAGLLLPAGAIGDRFGRKGVFIGGLIVFTIGCLVPIWTDTPDALIAARAVSGIGAAFVMPSTLSILASKVPTKRRPLAIAIWGASAGVGAVIGLVGSGAILLAFAWHGIFVALAGFAGLLVILSFTIEESKQDNPPRFDPVGAVLSSISIILLVLGLIEAPSQGWSDPGIIICLVLSLVFAIAFIIWELKSDHPLLDVRLFQYRGFGSGSFSLVVQFAATFGVFYTLVQFLQLVQGFSPIKSAFSMAPLVPPCIIFALLSIWLTRKIGQKWLLVLGHLVLAASLLMYIPVDAQTDYWYIMVIQLVFATGIGLTAAPATTAIMLQTPEKKYGVASAVNDATREIGAAIGIALAGSILTTIYSDKVTSVAQKVQGILMQSEAAGMAPKGSSADAFNAITGGLSGAQVVADKLLQNPMTAQFGQAVIKTGQDGFIDGLFVTAMALAALQIFTALLMAVWAPGYRVMKSRKELEGVQAATSTLPIPLMSAIDNLVTTRHLLVATDFDGTLAPFVKNANKATPLPGGIEALYDLAELPHTRTALISGRDVSGLRRVSDAPSNIILVGCHGAETTRKDSKLTKSDEQLLELLQREVKAVSQKIPGSSVEHKKYSVGLHIRGAKNQSQAAEAAAELEKRLSAIDGVHLNRGKLISEFSIVDVNKGDALRDLMNMWPTGADGVIYLGDDVTDENAFAAINKSALADGKDTAITVKVGEGETLAQYRITDELHAAAALNYLATERAKYAEEHFTRVERKLDKKEQRLAKREARRRAMRKFGWIPLPRKS